MNKPTVLALRFLFERGAFYDAIVPVAEAIQIVNDFTSGNCKPYYKGGPYDYVDGGGRWAVQTAGLIAVFQTAIPGGLVKQKDGGVGLGAGLAPNIQMRS